MKEILLNPGKTLSQTVGGIQAFEKLEVPVTISLPQAKAASSPSSFIDLQVSQMLMNSTIQLTFSYSYGETQLIVALYGPSETRGFKQDPSRAVLELSLRDTTATKETALGGSPLGTFPGLESLRSELKSIMEQVIHLGSYPRTLLSFQIFIIKKANEAQLFAACANSLLAVVNQAGIVVKAAPATALSVAVKMSDMEDDESVNIEIVDEPKESAAGFTMVDMVLFNHRDILYMRSSNTAFDFTSALLGNEKSLAYFESIIEKKSQQIFEAITAQPI